MKKDGIILDEEDYNRLNFGYEQIILHGRLTTDFNETKKMETFYIENYNNCRFLNSMNSKWGIFDLV